MSAQVIDARVQFGLSRMRTIEQREAKRDAIGRAALEIEIDVDGLELELRDAMTTGLGFDYAPPGFHIHGTLMLDDDGRVIET